MPIGNRIQEAVWVMVLFVALLPAVCGQDRIAPESTAPLEDNDDPASLMVDGIDRFLLREIAQARASRAERFVVSVSSINAYEASLKPHRNRLAECLGVRDARISFDLPQIVVNVGGDAVIAQSEEFTVERIRWPVLSDPSPQGQGLPSIFGEGLLLTPKDKIVANIVVLPDADQTPEQICGLQPGVVEGAQVARHLAQSGFRVVVPQLMSRHRERRLGRADLTSREYLHRAAFELGRTLAGYEVQMSLAVVDWFSKSDPELPIGIAGYGEGGMLALFAAALDTRIQATVVSGFFGPREQCWQEPMDRNFAGLLWSFGATELAMMVAPRSLIVETTQGPIISLDGNGGGPASLKPVEANKAEAELKAAENRLAGLGWSGVSYHSHHEQADGAATAQTLLSSFERLSADFRQTRLSPIVHAAASKADKENAASARESRLLKEIDRHNQLLLRESPFVRKQFLSKLDVSSVEAYKNSIEAYRDIFRDKVIGEFKQPLMPFNARSRKSWEKDKWTGHEVVLDVFPDVFAYGVLLLPRDLKPGEKRPVVVCQHGLEGRPTDTFLNDHPAYHDFAAKLCERGFITFAPQNPYIFTDRFRTLQRKAQPLGKSLFSVIVPQHQQIVNWLKTQSFVDEDRIAFYGLSYGGKSAMRIPALVTDYCLSICSADFNEWVLKNASTRENFSYIWTGEYEIFEWDLGSTFNYAEMAALICPRPFMVERGHFDGVGEDHWVAHEFAKVRHLYAARLGIGDRAEIEWFTGPHTINGIGTFKFLHHHLGWQEPR